MSSRARPDPTVVTTSLAPNCAQTEGMHAPRLSACARHDFIPLFISHAHHARKRTHCAIFLHLNINTEHTLLMGYREGAAVSASSTFDNLRWRRNSPASIRRRAQTYHAPSYKFTVRTAMEKPTCPRRMQSTVNFNMCSGCCGVPSWKSCTHKIPPVRFGCAPLVCSTNL